MLRRHRFRQAILGLVLLLGQWLAVAHAYEHPVLSSDQVCQICVHAQGIDSGALAPVVAALPEFGIDAPLPATSVRVAGNRRPAVYRSRAPPVVLG